MKGDKTMNINKIIKRKLSTGEEFSYRVLYNNDRGAIHKEEYEYLLCHCLKMGIIQVEKYLIEEKIPLGTFSDIVDEKGKERYLFKEKLKAYHQESDNKVAPFIYLLGKIKPTYELNMSREKFEDPVLSFPHNITVGHRVEGTNAFSRLFCVDSKVSVNSTNDDIETLIDTLEIDNVEVYILDIEMLGYYEQDIVLYKLIKNDEFKAVKNKVDEKITEKIALNEAQGGAYGKQNKI